MRPRQYRYGADMGEMVDLGGVYGFIRGDREPGTTNSGIIIDDDGLTVVDAQTTPADAAGIAAAIETFGLPVRRLVVTSSHLPFVGGSGVFSLAAVYGTPQISDHLDQPANLESCRALYPTRAGDLFDDIEPAGRQVTHTVTEGAWVSPSCVAAPLSGELDENLVVQVPDARIVFGGAMCSFGVTPMAGFGDPATWAASLETLLTWGDIFVPGHGPIGGSEEVVAQQAYLQACVDAQGDPGALANGPWSGWTARHFDEINIERAAALAINDRSPQPKLLRLLGLS